MKPSRTGRIEGGDAGCCFEFGAFRLDSQRRRLETADGRLLKTSAKAFDALQYFLANPGKPIARRTLMEALWPDTVVDENGLSQAIAGLRRALGDDYIVTVPGRGYQFVAVVRRIAEDAAHPGGNETKRPGQSSRPAWIGPAMLALAVAVAVGGSLYFSGIEPTDRAVTGIGSSPADRAQAGSAEVGDTNGLDAYGVPGGTRNERANEHYRLGKLLSLRDDREPLLQAVAEFARARALDEDFALAQIASAQVLYSVAVGSVVAEDIAESWQQFRRARDEVLQRWPDVPAVRGLAAERHVSANRWGQAESALAEWVELTAEQELEALSSYGAFLNQVGRVQDALPYLEAAHELRPDLAPPLIALSMAYHTLGSHVRAREADDKAMSLPGYRTMFAAPKFWSRLAAGDHLGAQQYFVDVAVATSGWDRRVLEDVMRTRELPPGIDAFRLMMAASVVHIDDFGRGLEHVRNAYANPELDNGPGMLNIALFAAHFGDINLSVDAWRRSLDHDRVPALQFVWLPLMQPVRRHHEFKVLMRQIGIVDYWRASGWPEHCRPLREDDFACT